MRVSIDGGRLGRRARGGLFTRLAVGAGLCWICCGVWVAIAAAEPTRHAILVGVNEYADPKVPSLRGAVNDVRNMERLLTREYDFPSANVKVLLNTAATLANIRREFALLKERCAAGDVVLFHFSGHGTSVLDSDGDEAEYRVGDTRDEALCPYDCEVSGRKNALIDDELDRLLDALPASEVVVALDCCHSGTGAKSVLAASLGAARVFPDDPALIETEKKVFAKSLEADPAAYSKSPLGFETRSSGDKRRVVFTACSSLQQAFEIEPPNTGRLRTGSLTYFLVQGLRGPADANADGEVSYAEAFAYARRRVDEVHHRGLEIESARQTPTLEGYPSARTLDLPMCGVRRRKPMLVGIRSVTGKTVRLENGSAHGLTLGQRLALYEADRDGGLSEVAKATIEIRSLTAITAEAAVIEGGGANPSWLASPLPGAPPRVRLSVVSETRRVLGTRLPLEVEGLLQNALGELEQLSDLEKQAESGDLRLVLTAGDVTQKQLVVTALVEESNGQTHGPRKYPLPLPLTPSEAEGFHAKLQTWLEEIAAPRISRASWAELINPRPGFGLQAVVGRLPVGASSLAEYKVDEEIKLGLKASADCWYYLLGVDPRGKVTLLARDGAAPADRKLLHPGPGEYLRLREPGVYVFKLIATREKLPASAFDASGLPRIEAIAALPASGWTESSVSLRVAAEGK